MRRMVENPGLRWPGALVMVLLAAGLMGLGGGDEGEGGRIPIPSESYAVTLTDRSGNTLEGDRFTWEGKVFLRAQFGNATVTVPFEKLASLKVTAADASDQVNVSAVMKDGETLALTVDATSKCYANTRFGDYEIFMADLAAVSFQ